MKALRLVALCSAVVFGCGEGDGSDSAPQGTPIEVTEASFDCILEGTKVRKFYVKNLIGELESSLAVANGDADPPYPPGTLLQLIPQEAMVKREVGFSPETGDWEFFFLNISSAGATIAQRGKDDAENALGNNCFACHAAATGNDFVCETGHGCDPIPVDDEIIEALQNGDVRCQ